MMDVPIYIAKYSIFIFVKGASFSEMNTPFGNATRHSHDASVLLETSVGKRCIVCSDTQHYVEPGWWGQGLGLGHKECEERGVESTTPTVCVYLVST
jgi:hypothetical protein